MTGMLLEPTALQRKSLELLDQVEAHPRLVHERMAAAEAHLRLVVTGAAGQREKKLLDRARSLDPYRAEVCFSLAIHAFRADSLSAAIEALDHAVLLAPTNASYRFHRAYVLLDAARRTHSSDLADAAREDFEWVLTTQPAHIPAAIGAIEATIYGKTKRLRESLRTEFARVKPTAAHVRTITRLLYQAIFAFGVGKAKNVDKQNEVTMSEIAEVARAWQVVVPSQLLSSVIAAAAAKCNNPEELCERLPQYAREISDVRVLRLLVRERLAQVHDPSKRLELFASAMDKIPPLDGIAQDYLQLIHLVAKRAVAEGDLDAAWRSWQSCLDIDADNLSTIQNLLRVAEHLGYAKETAQLTEKRADLFALYAKYSPRSDAVLTRAASISAAAVETQMNALVERSQKQQQPLSAADVNNVLELAVRADATARLGVDPSARAAIGLDVLGAIVDLRTPATSIFDTCLRVLHLPLVDSPATAYAYYDVAKDVPMDALFTALNAKHEHWESLANDPDLTSRAKEYVDELSRRAAEATVAIFDEQARAEYDRATSSIELTEFYRRHHQGVIALMRLALRVSDDNVPACIALASKLHVLRGPMLDAYAPCSEFDDRWLKRSLDDVAYGSLITRGYEAISAGQPERAVDLASPYVEQTQGYSRLQLLYARAILEDSRVEVREAVSRCRRHAQLAVGTMQPFDTAYIVGDASALAQESDYLLLQRAVAERARIAIQVKNDTGAGLRILQLAHSQVRGQPHSGPTSAAWVQVEPQGRALYAFAVAQALRSNMIAWYNAQQPYSVEQVRDLKMLAISIARACDRWIRYAQSVVSDESLSPDHIANIREGLANLASALDRDRINLMS